VLALLLVAVTWLAEPLLDRSLRPAVVLVVSAGFLIGAAAAGHAAMDAGLAGALHVAADALHLLAAAAWLGGLVPLYFVLRRSLGGSADVGTTVHCLMRFSAMGYGAVGMLIASGLLNAWRLVGSRADDVLASGWGQILALKLALVAMLLLIAAVNRLRLVPRLTSRLPRDQPEVLSALIRNVALEQGLGGLVLGLASALGTLPPPLGVGQ